jgi:hypothetical protein
MATNEILDHLQIVFQKNKYSAKKRAEYVKSDGPCAKILGVFFSLKGKTVLFRNGEYHSLTRGHFNGWPLS